MQRIIQINLAGRMVPIEEDAYLMLKDYITSLERQFRGDEGKEIIEDIENRIAELFAIRLQGGSHAIDRADVQKVIQTLGSASDLNDSMGSSGQQSQAAYSNRSSGYTGQGSYQGGGAYSNYRQYRPRQQRLLRDPFNKVIGGVCSGIAKYFDVDTTIIRLIMVGLFLTFGIGLLTYIIAWAVIPAARTREELFDMNGGEPVTFHDITHNVGQELEDLKRRGEQMSRELKDFFSKKR